MRDKAGCSAQQRLSQLLNSGLFHMVRDTPALLDKVHLLNGDLDSDDLGLSQEELHRVLSEVQVVFHCAALIELDADIQDTLRCNYIGTGRLLTMAMRMQQLRCFLHLSTAFVNAYQPRSSVIEERVYPLKMGSVVMQHKDVVEDLMSINPEHANVRVRLASHAALDFLVGYRGSGPPPADHSASTTWHGPISAKHRQHHHACCRLAAGCNLSVVQSLSLTD
jgi:fatty acyl-CoA reductase